MKLREVRAGYRTRDWMLDLRFGFIRLGVGFEHGVVTLMLGPLAITTAHVPDGLPF
jgi:hypothetical protein